MRPAHTMSKNKGRWQHDTIIITHYYDSIPTITISTYNYNTISLAIY